MRKHRKMSAKKQSSGPATKHQSFLWPVCDVVDVCLAGDFNGWRAEMKIAIVMSFFVVMSFSVLAENIDQVEKKQENKEKRIENGNSSTDINRKEAEEQKKGEIKDEEQSEKIISVEDEEDENSVEKTPKDERAPGQKLEEDSTEPGDLIPEGTEKKSEKERKNKKLKKLRELKELKEGENKMEPVK